MRSPLYRRALTRDLDRWIDEGLVPPGSRAAILATSGARGPDAAVVLGGFAAVLFGFAAISFVAANWAAIPDIVRAGLALALMWAAALATTAAFERRWNTAGDALALVTALSFGAALMLIAQVFHIQAHYPRGTLIWTLAAAATALAFRSRPPVVAAAVLALVWLWQEHANSLPIGILWGYAPVAGLILALSMRLKSSAGVHVSVLGLLGWAGVTLGQVLDASQIAAAEAVGVFGLIALGVALVGGLARDHGLFGGSIAASWGALAALVCGFVLQIAVGEADTEYGPAPAWALAVGLGGVVIGALLAWCVRAKALEPRTALAIAAGALGLIIGPRLPDVLGSQIAAELTMGALFFVAAAAAVAVGAQLERRSVLTMGVIALFAQALYVYARAAGGLLDTAAFFLVGALIFGGLAVLLARGRKRLLATEEPS